MVGLEKQPKQTNAKRENLHPARMMALFRLSKSWWIFFKLSTANENADEGRRES